MPIEVVYPSFRPSIYLTVPPSPLGVPRLAQGSGVLSRPVAASQDQFHGERC